MNIEVQAVLSQNITLVYDSLNLRLIDSGDLKQLLGDQISPTIMDTPETIVAVYPPEPVIVQIGDRRIRVHFPQQVEDIGGIPLWEIAVKCDKLVPKSDSTLVAYGFNYDVSIAITDEDAHAFIMDLFISSRTIVESALDGKLSSFVPRLRYHRDQTDYDLVLEPEGAQHIKVHMNSHFQFDGIVLPSQNDLRAYYDKEYEYLVSMLPRLLGEVEQ